VWTEIAAGSWLKVMIGRVISGNEILCTLVHVTRTYNPVLPQAYDHRNRLNQDCMTGTVLSFSLAKLLFTKYKNVVVML
jgi:hypothetical protein